MTITNQEAERLYESLAAISEANASTLCAIAGILSQIPNVATIDIDRAMELGKVVLEQRTRTNEMLFRARSQIDAIVRLAQVETSPRTLARNSESA
jgi:hypothetical protein